MLDLLLLDGLGGVVVRILEVSASPVVGVLHLLLAGVESIGAVAADLIVVISTSKLLASAYNATLVFQVLLSLRQLLLLVLSGEGAAILGGWLLTAEGALLICYICIYAILR